MGVADITTICPGCGQKNYRRFVSYPCENSSFMPKQVKRRERCDFCLFHDNWLLLAGRAIYVLPGNVWRWLWSFLP